MTDKAYYTSKFYPIAHDFDCKKELKVSTLLKYMQNIAGWHLEHLDCPNELMVERRQVFLLSKLTMQIESLPTSFGDIEVTTWSRGYKGATWTREYEFKNKDGELFCRASTIWVLFDPVERGILRPNAFFMQVPTGERSLDINVVRRFKIDNDIEHGEHVVRFSDLDTYMHMNNTVYADMVCDFAGVDMREYSVKEFSINYSAEARLGDTISISSTDMLGDTVYVRGCHNRGVCFEASIKLK